MIALDRSQLVATVGFCDPAGGRRPQEVKRVRAKSALVVVGMDAWARIFVLSAWAGRVRTTDLLDRLYTMDAAWHPRPFGIEANAMQSLFVDCAQYISQVYKGQRPALVPVNQPTHQEKLFRIRTILQPVIGQGRLFVQAADTELVSALRVFPRDPIIDLVDALASAVNLLPKQAKRVRRNNQADDLADYLRQCGVHPREIERRVEEVEKREAYYSTVGGGARA